MALPLSILSSQKLYKVGCAEREQLSQGHHGTNDPRSPQSYSNYNTILVNTKLVLAQS